MNRVLVQTVLVALLASGCRPPTPEARLAKEMEGTYPLEAKKGGAVKAFDIVAAETELPLLDGPKLKVWAYNGTVPGPVLRIRLGDTLRARFTNKLPQATTIHWHGVRLPNAMDGVPGVTQPPIEPGESFTYEFTPKDAGTFWFHPHLRGSEQVERGLYGVLIVEDEKPSPYTRDLVWVLDDCLLDEHRQIDGEFNTRHDLAHDGRWGNVITVNGRTDTRLELKGGERVRLRLLNVANGRMFAPQFPGLDVQVLAVDGNYLRAPIPLDRFELAPGNRLDLDVRVPADRRRTVAVTDTFWQERPNHLADIVVDDVSDAKVDFPSPAHALVPRLADGLATPLTQEIRLNARQGGPFGIEWTLNGEAFSHEQHHAHSHPLLTLSKGKWAHLRFTNDSYRLHPIHLHGMFFKLLARNGQGVDEPFFRDTVLVHGKETVDVGLVPLEEGRWMMHCHILEHAEAGMMSLIEVKAE